MAFLNKEELKTVSVPAVVQKVINADDTIVTQIIAESIAVMTDMLFERFDTDAIFSAEEDARHLTTLKHLKNIVINELYNRKTNAGNEITQLGYDEAMTWLEKVSTGRLPTTLPAALPEDDDDGIGDGFIKYGGNNQYQNGW